MSTLCVFRVTDSCCSGCRSTATKALKKAYGVSAKFDKAEAKLIVEGNVDPAKIIEVLQRKAKKVQIELVDGPRTVSTAANRDEGQVVSQRGDDGIGKKIGGYFSRLQEKGRRKGGNQSAGGEGSSSQNAGGFGGGSNADNADNAGGGGGGSNADGPIESSREEVNTSRNSTSSNSSNGEEIQEETQGGNMGQTVPMDQYRPNYHHPGQYGPEVPVDHGRPGYDMYPQYHNMYGGGYPQHPMHNMPQYDNTYGGYPQQPMDHHYFSDENPNGCSIM